MPEVEAAVHRLLTDLSAQSIPPTLVSQYLPAQYAAWRDGAIALAPADLVRHRVTAVLDRYGRATLDG